MRRDVREQRERGGGRGVVQHAQVERAAVGCWRRRERRELMRCVMERRRDAVRCLAVRERLGQSHPREADPHAADIGRMAPCRQSVVGRSPLGIFNLLQLLLELFDAGSGSDRIVYASVVAFCALLAPRLISRAFLLLARVQQEPAGLTSFFARHIRQASPRRKGCPKAVVSGWHRLDCVTYLVYDGPGSRVLWADPPNSVDARGRRCGDHDCVCVW